MSSLENKEQQKRKMQYLRRKLKEKRVANDRLTFLKAWYSAVSINYLGEIIEKFY